MKWKQSDYKFPFHKWRQPSLIYPCISREKNALHALKSAFQPLPVYKEMEAEASEHNPLVSVEVPLPQGKIAFLENTAEKCTSPQTKHSQAGMQGARHWVQRVDTPDNVFRRLTDGYGISLMFGERHHQYIRNSHNWRGISGMMLDLDVWYEQPETLKKKLEADDQDADFIAKRLAENEKRPKPVYSFNELFERYPLLPRICSFILPSASSLYEVRPFKARGVVLFPEPVTDMRVYRAFGDILLSEIDCIPANVTKNPVAVGFGNTHNAPTAFRSENTDTAWITDALNTAQSRAQTTEKKRQREQKQKAELKAHYALNGNGTTEGENISAFIKACDPIAEMLRDGLLTRGKGNEYRWHESEHDRSCDILGGSIHIFSASMFDASPHQNVNEAVGAHRFYLYQLSGLDMTRDADKPRIRELLFQRGYGSDPKDFAKANGYTPPTRPRYTINTEHKHATSDMGTERNKILKALVGWIQETERRKGKHLIILGSAAGTGKTTTVIFTVDGFLYIAKTTEEADKIFEELDKKEEDVIRHRPRLFNRGHKDIDGNNDWETLPLGLGEHERPCIQPELCNLHAERIGTTNYICKQCPLSAECKADGYLSQADKEWDTRKVIYAWDEVIACDERFAERVKRICTKDDILILDEVNPLALTQARHLNRDTLLDLTERFRQPDEETSDAFKTLEKLCDLISTAKTPETFIAGVKEWIDSIEDINALDDKLEKYPVGVVISKTPATAEHEQPFEATLIYQSQEVTVPVVDFETADDTPAFFVDPDTSIKTDTYQVRFVPFGFLLKVGLAALDDPPRRHRKMFSDLKTFFDENANIVTAPFTFDPKNQNFEYHLKPTLNHHQTIFNTASDPDNLIGEAYRDTDINITRYTGTPPPWKTDLMFQISTGGYLPRQSLITKCDGELHLRPRAQEFIDGYIQPSFDAGLKVLVVAPKAFQDVKSVKKWAVTDLEDFTQGRNALLTNHHHAEGRNDYQDFDIVFIFHYEPNHYEIQAAAKRIYRNPETPLDFTREKRTVTMGGVRFEKTVYIDDRVQAVYNRECRARLMQSAMRLRPNINEGKIIVFLTAEPVDIPVTPTPFHPQDATCFTGDWADFKEKLQVKANATVQERIAAGDSKSKAYRDTAPQRQQASKQEKADRDAEICQRYSDGQSKKRIADEMSIGQATVKRVLDKCTTHTISHQSSQNVISTSYSAMGKTVTPPNADVACVESETLHTEEVQPDHDTFFNLLDISTCFYGKQQLSPSEISQYTGIDESEVRDILDDWYQKVVISPGIGDKYWMTERDKKQLWDKILVPTWSEWEENFPGQKILCPPGYFNPHLKANITPN